MPHPKIFIVDDDPEELLILKEVVTGKGISEVTYFQDSEHLLSHLENIGDEELPTLVLSDLNMPKFSGLDVIKRIRSNSRYDQISVIIYSTSSFSHDIEICLRAGAKEFIVKPDVLSNYDQLVDKLIQA